MIDECPVFRPTLKEFTEKSFSEILIEYEAQCGTSGIFKVILLTYIFRSLRPRDGNLDPPTTMTSSSMSKVSATPVITH